MEQERKVKATMSYRERGAKYRPRKGKSEKEIDILNSKRRTSVYWRQKIPVQKIDGKYTIQDVKATTLGSDTFGPKKKSSAEKAPENDQDVQAKSEMADAPGHNLFDKPKTPETAKRTISKKKENGVEDKGEFRSHCALEFESGDSSAVGAILIHFLPLHVSLCTIYPIRPSACLSSFHPFYLSFFRSFFLSFFLSFCLSFFLSRLPSFRLSALKEATKFKDKVKEKKKGENGGDMSKFIKMVLDHRLTNIVVLVSTVIALFGVDFVAAFLPKDPHDVIMGWISFVIFIVFIAELTLASVYKMNYFLSFFFFLDVLGYASFCLFFTESISPSLQRFPHFLSRFFSTSRTLSLIPDIPLFMNAVGVDRNGIQLAKAGRVVRSGTRTYVDWTHYVLKQIAKFFFCVYFSMSLSVSISTPSCLLLSRN